MRRTEALADNAVPIGILLHRLGTSTASRSNQMARLTWTRDRSSVSYARYQRRDGHVSESNKPLTGHTMIGAWLEHPAGGAVLRQFGEQLGMQESALRLLRRVPLETLIAGMGDRGEGVLDTLTREANGREVSPEEEAESAGWVERISAGRFDGRTVIVTGAASGIGRAVAVRIAREGGTVVAVDIAESRLADLVAAFPSVRPVAADITADDGVARIVEAAGARIDGLANVAGLLDDFSPLHETDDAMLRRVFEVNVFGLVRLSRAVIPAMIAAGRGSIVNVASEAALRGSSAGLAYTASKSAVLGVTRSSAFMYEPNGIRVNAVAPGGTLTGMRPTATNTFGQERLNSHTADVPIAVPEALAASITFLLSDDGVNVSGALLPSDGGESVF